MPPLQNAVVTSGKVYTHRERFWELCPTVNPCTENFHPLGDFMNFCEVELNLSNPCFQKYLLTNTLSEAYKHVLINSF